MASFDSLAMRMAKKTLMRRLVMSQSLLRQGRHSELSVLVSADGDVSPNDFLFDQSLLAIQNARETNLEDLTSRNKHLPDAVYYDIFPGEHYRLLHALARNLGKRNIVEIGTYTGMGSASLEHGMPESCKLTTFDIIPWGEFRTHLDERSFAEGRVVQFLEDISDPKMFDKHLDLLNQSEIIFCDAPKDGVFEPKFLSNLTRIKPTSSCLLILDDIRLLNMVGVWRAIRSPKLDMTSFGHWSGTGLVDVSNGFQFEG